MAYPGSALYAEAVSKGWRLPEDWSGYSQHAFETLPLATKHLSAEEVLAFRDHAFQMYFNHPPYLKLIENKFGPETLRHVREMTSHTLKRKYTSEELSLGTASRLI